MLLIMLTLRPVVKGLLPFGVLLMMGQACADSDANDAVDSRNDGGVTTDAASSGSGVVDDHDSGDGSVGGGADTDGMSMQEVIDTDAGPVDRCRKLRRNESSPLSDAQVAEALSEDGCSASRLRCINDLAYQCSLDEYDPDAPGYWFRNVNVTCPLVDDATCSELQREGYLLQAQFDLSCSSDGDCLVETQGGSCDCSPPATETLYSVNTDLDAYWNNREQLRAGGCDFWFECLAQESQDFICDAAPSEPVCNAGTCELVEHSCFDYFDASPPDASPPDARAPDAEPQDAN